MSWGQSSSAPTNSAMTAGSTPMPPTAVVGGAGTPNTSSVNTNTAGPSINLIPQQVQQIQQETNSAPAMMPLTQDMIGNPPQQVQPVAPAMMTMTQDMIGNPPQQVQPVAPGMISAGPAQSGAVMPATNWTDPNGPYYGLPVGTLPGGSRANGY